MEKSKTLPKPTAFSSANWGKGLLSAANEKANVTVPPNKRPRSKAITTFKGSRRQQLPKRRGIQLPESGPFHHGYFSTPIFYSSPPPPSSGPKIYGKPSRARSTNSLQNTGIHGPLLLRPTDQGEPAKHSVEEILDFFRQARSLRPGSRLGPVNSSRACHWTNGAIRPINHICQRAFNDDDSSR